MGLLKGSGTLIKGRISELRQKMAEKGLCAYIVPSADPHQSEYLADHDMTIEFISGFTGSAGDIIITKDKAGLWTDGRYFIQAVEELEGSGVDLYKLGDPEYPTMAEFLVQEVSPGMKIGFNGETMAYSMYRDFLEKVGHRLLISNVDIIDEIWKDRPELPRDKTFVHDKKYSGISPAEKIENLRDQMKKKAIDHYLITDLAENCYLFSIRGSDIAFNPQVFSYGLITLDKAYLFIDKHKLDDEMLDHLAENGVKHRPYKSVVDFLKELPSQSTLYFDKESTNLMLAEAVPSFVKTVHGIGIVSYMKARKNQTELDHQKEAYLKDGVALIKFFNWVETGAKTGSLTESIASDKLTSLRQEQEDFVEPSFGTILAYGKNAAMPHYSPSEKEPVTLREKGFCLIDSGGQYLDGTTDITRTIALGDLTEEEKRHYTLTLKSHIGLADAIFMKGANGYYLDGFARAPLWKEAINYNHGTGHGVGFFMNVHEGPQRLAFSPDQGRVPLEPGMVVSVEPGIYIQGSHGVRIENIVAVQEYEENEYGTFYSFDMLSYVPIDTRPILKELMTEDEINWLNDYNQACLEKLGPRLEGSDLDYLEASCQPLV